MVEPSRLIVISAREQPLRFSSPNITLSLLLKQEKQDRVSQLGAGRILFVDDEESISRLGEHLLGHLGYTVTACTSALKALETFRTAPDQFDVVITDQTMPKMNGETLVGELLRIQPKIPVILCTGFSHTMTPEKSQTDGYPPAPHETFGHSRIGNGPTRSVGSPHRITMIFTRWPRLVALPPSSPYEGFTQSYPRDDRLFSLSQPRLGLNSLHTHRFPHSRF